ncbi:MAG: alpha/beta hydrolase [Actinomycetota bacterium]|nr:alpha/beta hydrolase [Actinomycetota bacterium]
MTAGSLDTIRRALVAGLAISLVGGCGETGGVSSKAASPIDDGTAPATEDSTATTPQADEPLASYDFQIEWSSQEDDVETGTLEVPVDYEDPEGPTFRLHVVRHLAADEDHRIGSLLVNPGGPGFGGSEYAQFAESIYGEPLLQRFDIVGWDPRGTGLSEPAIDCLDDYDRFYAEPDITPDTDADRQERIDLAEEFAESCVDNNAAYLEHVGTNNSARDMEALRLALGEQQISYFGFSYGSELGATWATLFPGSVRAAVLDGAADPTAELNEGALQQYAGFEESLTSFLADCSERAGCPFHNGGDAEGAYDELLRQLDDEPIPTEDDRPDANQGVAIQASVTALYSAGSWPVLAQALADAQDGDGAGLMELFDSYFQRSPDGTWGNELEAFQTIVCMDTAERETVEQEDAQAAEFQAVAPRLAPGDVGDYFCTFFPESLDPRIEVTGQGAGPVLVIGTTGDPATPLSSTEAMAESLEDGVLLVVDADQHTGYSASECAMDTVHEYLVELEVPDGGAEC